MSEERKSRGRPRPEFTIERDEQILGTLRENGLMSRVAMASLFGVNVNIIYLSLTRLRKTGQVKTVRDGKRHLWSIV